MSGAPRWWVYETEVPTETAACEAHTTRGSAAWPLGWGAWAGGWPRVSSVHQLPGDQPVRRFVHQLASQRLEFDSYSLALLISSRILTSFTPVYPAIIINNGIWPSSGCSVRKGRQSNNSFFNPA